MQTVGETDLVFTRLFHAPPLRVWTCFTTPALVRQWLWAMDMPMVRCEMDVRVGGTFRWVWAGRDGVEMGMGGTYHEVTPHTRIVNTETFDEDWTGGETRVTTDFLPVAEGTRMVLRVRYASSAARAGAMATGMADGMEQTYAKLDDALKDGMAPYPRPTVNLSIDVPDLDAGLRFYAEVCGFHETARPFPTMAVLDANNLTVCLHAKPAGSAPSAAGADTRRYDRHWTPVHIDLHTEDFDGTLARLTAAGGTVEHEFRDTGPRLAAFCADPFGNGICLIGPARPKA